MRRCLSSAAALRAVLLIVPPWCLAGCVGVTKYPIYDAGRDTLANSRLVGDWYVDGFDLRVGPAQGGGYEIGPMTFEPWPPATEARGDRYDLTRIGDRFYMFPAPGGSGTMLFGAVQVKVDGNDRVRGWFLNVFELHGRVRTASAAEGGDRYALLPSDEEEGALARAAEAGKSPETRPTTKPWAVVLADPPERIRRYLIAHQDDPKLFVGPVVARRWVSGYSLRPPDTFGSAH
ncbi:MAG: hypothetical protein JWO31_3814 [Phycisphaerales bacterium]|nr:hypothetical protein [Phycisphaerales bacterium]